MCMVCVSFQCQINIFWTKYLCTCISKVEPLMQPKTQSSSPSSLLGNPIKALWLDSWFIDCAVSTQSPRAGKLASEGKISRPKQICKWYFSHNILNHRSLHKSIGLTKWDHLWKRTAKIRKNHVSCPVDASNIPHFANHLLGIYFLYFIDLRERVSEGWVV